MLWRINYGVFAPVFSIILYFEYHRSQIYCQDMRGNFAVDYPVNQIYWLKQRWHIKRKPLLLNRCVIINLKSLRSGQHRTLFLVIDNLSPEDWRSLCYFLNRVKI